MFTLFGTIIFVYVMWLVVKPLVSRYMRRKFQQKVNDMFRQAMGGAPGTSGSDPFGAFRRGQQQPPEPEKPVKRKIFSRDEGEYIEFEEVHIQVEYTETTTETRTHTPREPQISDADWEEIGR